MKKITLTQNVPGFRPVLCERGCSEELLVGVLLVDVLFVKVLAVKVIDQQLSSGKQLNLGKVGEVDKRFVPIPIKHSSGEVHANSSNVARLSSEELMVEEGDFHQELGERSSLDIVIVGLRDLSDPTVR